MLTFMVLSLQTSPYSLFFPHFALQKESCNPQKTMDPPPGTACQTQVTGLSDASLLTVLKQCRKKEYRILTYLLFISNLWLWAPIAWSPWFPMGAGETQFLRHKPTVFSPLPASGLKPSFYLKKKKKFFSTNYKVPILFLFAVFQNSQ